MSNHSDSTNQPASRHSLPAKPPQSQTGFSFKPRNVASARPAAQPHRPAQEAASVNASYPQPNTASYGAYSSYDQGYAAQSSYNGAQDYSQWSHQGGQYQPSYGAGGDYGAFDADTEEAIQMQQWQANYGSNDADGKPRTNANSVPLTQKPGEARKTVVRHGGGQKWEDPTLLEWGDAHRMFVGNLAGEVTDESLLKAFSKYASVQKARVIREKRTSKSKGYGFVSFTDADDFFQAAKDMQGKYIGSHPVLIKRAETDIKVTNKKPDQRHGGHKPKPQSGSGTANGAKKDAKNPLLAPKPGAGVQKKPPPSKYKMLG